MPSKPLQNPCLPPRPGPWEVCEPLSLRLWAPAKINLNLLVGALRTDGFHPVDSMVAKISLYDQIDLRRTADGSAGLVCRGARCGPDESNLAMRAARLLLDRRGDANLGVEISLAKHIPPGAGLGGGSSDAAAVLRGLNVLWSLGMGDAELSELASRLGSDVPLFLGPPASRMTGRGEMLAPADVSAFYAVLILPPIVCPTAEVYRAFDEQQSASRLAGEQLEASTFSRPASTWRGSLVNQLEAAAVAVAPELGQLLSRLRESVSLPVHLTGSGSAMFILCDDQAEARGVMDEIPADLRALGRIVQSNPW